MFFGKEKKFKQKIIEIGKRLADSELVVGRGGNLSNRIEKGIILITATGTALGELTPSGIIKVNLNKLQGLKDKRLTTEFPLHRQIYEKFSCRAIIHCHPPLINGYFAVYSDIKALTFETKLFLGNIPVVEQETPAVTKPEVVAEALKSNNLAVLKNHGVVSIGDNFKDALYLIENLEEAVKTAAVARLFKKEILDDLDKGLKDTLTSKNTYDMFSKGHIQAIVDLVNQDEFILQKGEELDLTLKLAIKLDGSDNAYKFNFEKGRIVRLDSDTDAPFVISASRDIWELIFLGKLNPFVAVTQGKMKLQGHLGQLSRWYVPFNRLFELFKQVRIK